MPRRGRYARAPLGRLAKDGSPRGGLRGAEQCTDVVVGLVGLGLAAPPSADGAHKFRRRVASDPIRGSTDELLDDVEGERARAGTTGVLHLDGVPIGVEVSQRHGVREDAEHLAGLGLALGLGLGLGSGFGLG